MNQTATVKGYQTTRTHGDQTLATLYAVPAAGVTLVSNEHPLDSHFDRKGRTWSECQGRPGNAEFIGNYPPVVAK